MTYDPNNLDPNRPLNPTNGPDFRTTPVGARKSNSWVGWVAAIAVVAVAAFAYMEWNGSPDTDPQTTASTKSEPAAPAPAPATPMAPADNSATPAPAPATPPAGGGTTQQ